MNRGTAYKWIEMLRSGDYNLDYSQICLRMVNDKIEDTFDPMGVLCDLLDPNGWKLDSNWFAYSWHGSQSYIDESMLKKGKIKNKEFNFIDEFGNQQSLTDFSAYYSFVAPTVSELITTKEVYPTFTIDAVTETRYIKTLRLEYTNVIEKYYEQF